MTPGDTQEIATQAGIAGDFAVYKAAENERQQQLRQNVEIQRQAQREAAAFADHYDVMLARSNEALQHRLETYELEAQAIGKNAGQLAQLRAEEEMRHRAARDNTPITEDMIRMTEAIGRAAQNTAEL